MAFLFKKVETFLLGKDLRPDEEQFKIDSAARFALLVRAVRGIGLVRVWCVCMPAHPRLWQRQWARSVARGVAVVTPSAHSRPGVRAAETFEAARSRSVEACGRLQHGPSHVAGLLMGCARVCVVQLTRVGWALSGE